MARVLMVEDDADQRRIRTLILERRGHIVRAAASAPEALEAMAGGEYDVLLTDLKLPDIENGRALLREMKARRPGLRVVVLSGWIQDFEKTPERVLADCVMEKPARMELLLAAIEGEAHKR